ncbi:MAG: potassium channel protein, partial [Candidatus Wallbacteria bacterium]|nr:potassium channel protein [Candidatus Wallbacteria bacterium]
MTDNSLKTKCIKLFFLALIPVAGGSFGYYLLFGDQYSLIDYVYMTVITITTVGFGEIVDLSESPEGRILTIFILAGGMGTLMYAVSTLTAFIVEGTFQHVWRRKKMENAIGKFENHIIVCGCGETGNAVVHELYNTRRDFVIVESSKEIIEGFEQFNQANERQMFYVCGDSADEEVLHKAGVSKAGGLITALREDKDNLFVTITARRLNPKMRIVVRAANLGHKRKFFRAGANAVVSPNFIGGMRLVSEMVRPHAVTFMDSMLGRTNSVMRFEEMIIDEKSSFSGKKIIDLELQKKTGCLLMAIRKKDSQDFQYIPDQETVLETGMVMVVLGDVEHIQKLK